MGFCFLRQDSGPLHSDHHIDLVVKVVCLKSVEILCSNPACTGFPGHTNDFIIGTTVTALPGAWRNRVSAGTGWSSVSIL